MWWRVIVPVSWAGIWGELLRCPLLTCLYITQTFIWCILVVILHFASYLNESHIVNPLNYLFTNQPKTRSIPLQASSCPVRSFWISVTQMVLTSSDTAYRITYKPKLSDLCKLNTCNSLLRKSDLKTHSCAHLYCVDLVSWTGADLKLLAVPFSMLCYSNSSHLTKTEQRSSGKQAIFSFQNKHLQYENTLFVTLLI